MNHCMAMRQKEGGREEKEKEKREEGETKGMEYGEGMK